jgi:hypothetical protein
MTNYYGGYVEWMQARTRNGKYLRIAAQENWKLSTQGAKKTLDFRGGCL